MLYDDYKCPYCGKELDLSWDGLEYVSIDDCINERMFQYECPHCEKVLNITPSVIFDFEVEKCECQGEDHVWKLTSCSPRCMAKMRCIHCGEERELTEEERKEFGIETVAEYFEKLHKEK